MPDKGQYQHFIPKFLLRKYDAKYQEPDEASYQTDPQYNGGSHLAYRAWQKEKKVRQGRASVNVAAIEKFLEKKVSEVSDEVLKERKDRKEERKALKKAGKDKKETRLRTMDDSGGKLESADGKYDDAECSGIHDRDKKDAKDEKDENNEEERADANITAGQHHVDKVTLGQRNCNTICGLINMYERETENDFSKMERRTADIIKVLEKDIAEGKGILQLSQSSLHQIRHFLFMMLYRSSSFYDRYNTTTNAYNGSDKASLLEFMKAKAFTEPIQVWNNSFRIFLEFPPKPDLDAWKAELLMKAYPVDATRFVEHVTNYDLCFCRPNTADDAFILTQNAYGVYDRSSTLTDTLRCWHFFAPISPRFMILLKHRALSAETHKQPRTKTSWLQDMPLKRPVQNDVYFDFECSAIPSRYVRRINSLFLEHATDTELIIYPTTMSLWGSLDVFLRTAGYGIGHLFGKNPTIVQPMLKASGHEVQRLEDLQIRYDMPYLMGLAKLAKEIEKADQTSWAMEDVPREPPYDFELTPEEFSPQFADRYKKLGWNGSPQAWKEDFAQAYRIAVADHGWEESRSLHSWPMDNQPYRHRLVATLDSRHVWLRGRLWGAFHNANLAWNPEIARQSPLIFSEDLEGFGDLVVDVSHLIPETSLSALLNVAYETERLLVWSTTETAEAQVFRAMMHFWLTLNYLGSIRKCGLTDFVDIADDHHKQSQSSSYQNDILRASQQLEFDPNYLTELGMRAMMEALFGAVCDRLSDVEKTKLKRVLFEIAYPIKIRTLLKESQSPLQIVAVDIVRWKGQTG